MKSSVAVLLSVAVLAASPLHAQGERDEEIAELRAELERLRARLDALERREGAAATTEEVRAATSGSAAMRIERVRLSGDVRYRHETINDDASTERHRQRIRARVGVDADVTDDLSLGLVLATGGDNPVSANQSLDTGFSRKGIGVDRAFFDWSVSERIGLRGGKMRNPMFRPGGHPLVFDGDLNPEGLALMYESAAFFANVAGLWVEERAGGDDSILLGAQAGFRRDRARGVSLTAGLGYYDYSNTRGSTPFYNGEGKGNTLDASGGYLNDYDQLELFAEATLTIGGQPATVFADYVRNTAASTPFDTGYAFGLRYRDAAAPGSWDLAYAYEDLEADAVVATFTDSDFAGGGTDGKGHVLEANYVLRERWRLGLTYFMNQRGAADGSARDYDRLQADVTFEY